MEYAFVFLGGMAFMWLLFVGSALVLSRLVPDEEPEWTAEAQRGLIDPKDGE